MWRCREEGPRKEGGDEERQVPSDTVFTRMDPWAHQPQWPVQRQVQLGKNDGTSVNCGHFSPCRVIDGADSRALPWHGQAEGRLLPPLLWCLLMLSLGKQDDASKGPASYIERSWGIYALFYVLDWVRSSAHMLCSYIQLHSSSDNGPAPLNSASTKDWRKFVW